MSHAIYAVYGAAGCGRSLMPIAREQLAREGITAPLCFIDDGVLQDTLNGHAVYSYAAFKALDIEHKCILIAIANSQVRAKLAAQIAQDGMQLWQVQANNSIIMDAVQLGQGAALSPFVTIGSNVQIGQCFHANLYSYVEHDCKIGDYVTFAPAVKCNGNVYIGDHAYIGAGAVIKQGTPEQPLRIGQGAVVGMGAVVTKDVAPYTTVVGNPAHVMLKTQS